MTDTFKMKNKPYLGLKFNTFNFKGDDYPITSAIRKYNEKSCKAAFEKYKVEFMRSSLNLYVEGGSIVTKYSDEELLRSYSFYFHCETEYDMAIAVTYATNNMGLELKRNPNSTSRVLLFTRPSDSLEEAYGAIYDNFKADYKADIAAFNNELKAASLKALECYNDAMAAAFRAELEHEENVKAERDLMLKLTETYSIS